MLVHSQSFKRPREESIVRCASLANSNRCLPNPPPPLVATTRTRGVRVVSTGATGLASRRTPASVSNHHVAPPFPQGARRCSASAPLGVGSRRAAAIPGGECTHPQFVHGRGHAPAFGRFAHVSPSPLVARQSEFCGSRPSLSLGRCAMCGVRDYTSVRANPHRRLFAVYYLGKVVKDRTVQLARTLRTTPSMVPAMLPAQPLVTCKSWSHEPAAFANSS